MTDKETGGAAFPIIFEKEDYIHDGMTLRDYFAANAMTGVLSTSWPDKSDVGEIVRRAYEIADTMLEARK